VDTGDIAGRLMDKVAPNSIFSRPYCNAIYLSTTLNSITLRYMHVQVKVSQIILAQRFSPSNSTLMTVAQTLNYTSLFPEWI
jgi:hypothetical protein